MTTQQHVVPLTSDAPRSPLRILRVVPPEPPYGPGTYDVRLELSRPLTVHERRLLPGLARGMLPVRRELVVYDTTVERVAARADELSDLMGALEHAGRQIEEDVEARARTMIAARDQERARLAELARSIRFPA
jgi:hypothetical protein